MVATALGDVSADEVWRVLRRHGIHLRRRRSWCISTDPEFAAKAADVVGLYLAPPANAVVIFRGREAAHSSAGSLKTTNALESIHARVDSRTAKVDHWKNSEQKQRWLATALLNFEPRLRRIRNYRALPLLREAIKRQLQGVKKSAA